ncbi:MAG: inosine/xanthosine triphosphatase [Alteromonadaceae bacterium]|jgi:inosine/xanthosine triphosphatase
MTNNPLKVVVGSLNPVKVNAVKNALQMVFADSQIECQGMRAPSEVADQPMTADETRKGAINRVNYCKAHCKADFYVAIEGGVDQFEYGPATFAYVVIANQSRQSVGRSAILPLPSIVFKALEQGEELGHVMDRLFNTDNIKQKGGAIALLTNGCATRQGSYTQALIQAMAPFLYPELFERI